jgi:CheY-like chemotaxis protein
MVHDPTGNRILVVDDEENFRHILSVILKKERYEVETASNGEEALQRILNTTFDQVLCDIRMPEWMDSIF